MLVLPLLKVHADDPIVIVIDPGHGGENLGAEYSQYTEKYMNMAVARAMKEELEKYEGVVVYLTHESADVDMELIERAEFASEKNADILFSLHFNMSQWHNYFGAEVWVSAFDQYYAQGHAFAQIEMDMLTDLGLYSRGIKTRLNDREEDYYGIIRESRKLGLNAVLIEHCHLDQANDQPFYSRDAAQLKEFGRLDATAAAKYFRLRSEELGVDYSDYPVPAVDVPSAAVKPDLSPPDVCVLEMDHLDETSGEAIFTLTAQDYESRILYYCYSLDGGQSYMPLEPFPEAENAISFTVMLPFEQNLLICVEAHNAFDQETVSNVLEITALPDIMNQHEEPEIDIEAENSENTDAGSAKTESGAEADTEADRNTEEMMKEEKTAETEMDEISLEELAANLRTSQEQLSQVTYVYFGIIIAISLMILVLMILVAKIIMTKRLYKSKSNLGSKSAGSKKNKINKTNKSNKISYDDRSNNDRSNGRNNNDRSNNDNESSGVD